MVNSSSPDQPWPVHVVAAKVKGWVEKLDWVWLEGQVVQLNRRPGASLAYAVLRDTDQDVSVDLTMFTSVLDGLDLQPGHKVVVEAKPEFWTKKGRLSFRARQIRLAGIGELLAGLERLRRKLATEGLFDLERKKALPFAPAVVGLITGRESDAEKDVTALARQRWPTLKISVAQVAVQGPTAASQVVTALAKLDQDPMVEVIVIARGGGAVEDLLPFSDENLLRAVAAANTPVISAIGHQADTPLLDLVADLRAATPTDAAKQLVPSAADEAVLLDQGLTRMAAALTRRLDRERQSLAAYQARPALTDPAWIVGARAAEVEMLAKDATDSIERFVTVQVAGVATLGAKLTALSPQATLDRGYAVVTTVDGQLVTKPSQAPAGTTVNLRLAGGTLPAETR
ncbi:MAG: exodeoxyribonuclease VII large subunit [Micrococcales bacterium]|nr:exodeoxyribonuclease VII large subunit [Micrococcales bacterium]